jgi:hypothetical protein
MACSQQMKNERLKRIFGLKDGNKFSVLKIKGSLVLLQDFQLIFFF